MKLQMKRQIKRSSGSQESSQTGEKMAFADNESRLSAYMEQDDAELEEVDEEDDEDDERASRSCGLGGKKRRLALEQVRALERNFETDNKLDPDRKARIARELGLQPRQVAVWFQNRRARWKTKQLERDFTALRTRHDALRADCDALRRDKDALAAEVRELREKLSKSGTSVKVEASNDAAEEPLATVGMAAAAVCKDGSSDSDSSVVFNAEASPYSGVVFEHPGFMGFSSSLLDSAAAAVTTSCSSLPILETRWNGTHSYHPNKSGGYGFTEEWFAGTDVIGQDGAGFFSEEHVANLNFGWCGNVTTDGFDHRGYCTKQEM